MRMIWSAGCTRDRPEEWTVLSLPAIAEENEEIQIGEGREPHVRRAGICSTQNESRCRFSIVPRTDRDRMCSPLSTSSPLFPATAQ